MRKAITQAIIIAISLYVGACVGTAQLNKAAKITADKAMHGVKTSCEYVKAQWDDGKEGEQCEQSQQ